tara:strand:- start:551 stop:1147 length:597 start_codon:yes stop_codon:yes gene_type:complete
MKLIQHIPIVHNGIFRFKLDIKKEYMAEFKKQKFICTEKNYNLNFISSNLNMLSKYKILNKQINKTIKYFIENILFMKCKFKIYSSWLTLTKPKGNSSSHSHSNSWISGVYYPEHNKEHKIIFYNDIKNNFQTTTHNQSIYNSKSFTIVPEQNELILFFSDLRHEIKTNLSDKDRYSLAFNCLPSGGFGEGDSYSEYL